MPKVAGPYDYERLRHRLGEYPRASQPNISQPNQITRVFGSTTREYWDNVFKDYIRRRGGK